MGPADAISGLNVFQKQSSQESVAEGEVAAWDPGSRVRVTAVSPNSLSTLECSVTAVGAKADCRQSWALALPCLGLAFGT